MLTEDFVRMCVCVLYVKWTVCTHVCALSGEFVRMCVLSLSTLAS